MITNLKRLREQKGISQQQLADAVIVSQQSINKYENHMVEPSIETLIRLASYFDTTVDYLIGNTTNPRRIENVHEYDLNDAESRLIDIYRKSDPKDKTLLLDIAERLNKG